jgi:hypothetical protein
MRYGRRSGQRDSDDQQFQALAQSHKAFLSASDYYYAKDLFGR